MNKRAFFRAVASLPDQQEYLSGDADGVSVSEYTSDMENSLLSFRIGGNFGDTDNGFGGKGVGTLSPDGKVRLSVRVHGENWCGAEELIRLMKKNNCPCYGGEYDDEHFIYICRADKEHLIAGKEDMRLKNAIYTLSFTGLITEDMGDGAVVPGIHFLYVGNVASAISSATGAVGEQSFTGKNKVGNIPHGFIHKPVEAEFQLPIRYDSVRLYTGSTDPGEYVGTACEFVLDDYLYAMSSENGEEIDVLDAVTGTVKRVVKSFTIDEKTEISNAIYEGYPCMSIPLPEIARVASIYCERLMNRISAEDLLYDEVTGYIVPPSRDRIYFRLSENSRDPDEALLELCGAVILYPIEEQTIQLETALDVRTPAGKVIIEVADNLECSIDATYKYGG